MAKPIIRQAPAGDGNGAWALKARRKVYFRQAAGAVECPIYDREKLGHGDLLPGPCIVEEWSSTIIVFPRQQLEVDAFGNLVIHTHK